MKGKRIGHTLKFKLMSFLLILVIPLIGILYWNNYYSIRLAMDQMNDYTIRLLDNYVEQLNTRMSNVSEYLLQMCLGDARNLNISNGDARYLYRRELHEELQNVIGFYDTAQGIFVYQADYDEYAHYTAASLSYTRAETIGAYVRSHLSEILSEDAATWNMVEIDDSPYFFYTLKTGETYLGAWVSVDEILEQIYALELGNLVSVSFVGPDSTFTDAVASKGGAAVSSGAPAPAVASESGAAVSPEASANAVASEVSAAVSSEAPANAVADESTAAMAQTAVAAAPTSAAMLQTYDVSSHLEVGDLDIVTVLETVPLFSYLSIVQKVIIAASIIIVILMLCSLLIYRRYIFTPLKNIKTAIGRVEQGDWNYRIHTPGRSGEFDSINQNFNDMAGEIHHLKIDVYEKEIERQQVELEYLHYQIKPHFILNVINTINSMAQIRETALIQKMTQYLSGYVRYTFRKDHSMSTIREELENVKNYLGMQLLRFPDSLECEIDIENRIMDVEIPAMTIMTFVENIMKHAFDMYDCIQITLKAFIDSEGLVHIVIRDSGAGFTDEAIEHIMTCETIGDGGRQVGIVNIKKRLRLIYGGRARVKASNDHGAKIEIVVPHNVREMERKESNECTDRR